MSKEINSVKDLGLVENAKYGDECRAEIFHDPSNAWLPVVETRNKVVYYLDENEKSRKANLNKISQVNVVDKNKSPVSLKKESEVPNQEPLDLGLMTNTDYSNTNVKVEHEDKGWMPLIRTANKVLYVRDGAAERRMTHNKLVSVSGVEDPEVEDEEVLTKKESPDNVNEEFDFREEVFFTEPGEVG